ncbi:hypothetical protein HMPREF1548_03128 [Clostridium sp. KLE 1755]|nr:hypothetical protein HMPREF1548_03128 [Clostridium sp. KLE 1755]
MLDGVQRGLIESPPSSRFPSAGLPENSRRKRVRLILLLGSY